LPGPFNISKERKFLSLSNLSNQQKEITFSHLGVLLCLCGGEGLVVFSSLLSGASDAENQFLLGYSIPRLLLLFFIICLSAFFFFLSFECFSRNKKPEWLLVLSFNPISFTLTFFLTCFFFLSFLFWPVLSLHKTWRILQGRFFPIYLWLFAITFQFTIIHIISFQKRYFQKLIFSNNSSFKTVILIFSGSLQQFAEALQNPSGFWLLPFILVFPIIFQNAIRYAFPTGYAGLYSLMAESIANNHFLLPSLIPYYGPGGIPFAYPPFSFYLMAAVTSFFKITAFEYTRWAAPFFLWLSAIPMAFLAYKITRSRLTAALAVIFFILSPRIYLWHGEAAGMTRGLALLFALSSLVFFYQTIIHFNWKTFFYAAFFLGLCVLTHPTYVEFCLISMAAIILTRQHFSKSVLVSIGIGLTALMISSPYLITTISRFGLKLFANPGNSMQTMAFIQYFTNPRLFLVILTNIGDKLSPYPLLVIFSLIGLCICLVKRNFIFLVWAFLLAFLMEGYDIVLYPCLSILAGIGLCWLTDQTKKVFRLTSLVPIGLITLTICGFYGYQSFIEISHFSPAISNSTIKAAEWLKTHSTADSKYLLISSYVDEMEWFPYLASRTPVIGSWGGEWIGTYNTQLGAVYTMADCASHQSSKCVQSILDLLKVKPDYYVVDSEFHNDQILQDLDNNPAALKVFHGSNYLIYKINYP
jgi:hypothetical protein